MILYLIYFLVFVAAILLFETVILTTAARRRRRQTINRRLRKLGDLPENISALSLLLEERGIEQDGAGESVFSGLRRLWVQSGLTVKPAALFLVTTGVAAALALVVFLSSSNVIATSAVFAFGVFAIPLFVLSRKRKQRIAKFTKQLPNALDIVVRSLRAGHPVASAIALVARETPDPTGTEFGIVSDELTYGRQMEEAMTHLSERVGAEELRLLVTTISVQRSTGGNLAEVLQNLGSVIRERIQMRARIRALSAEGRFTAWLMAAFPFVIYFALNLITPTYFDSFWQSSFVVPVLITCAIFMIVGNYILFRMVNFDF